MIKVPCLKKIILVCAALISISIIGCGGGEKREESYEDGKIKLRYYVKEVDGNFLKHGKYQRWYHDGTKAKEIEYKNGKRNGNYLTWYENGTKMEECKYINGKPNGLYASWHENGKKEDEIGYKDGEKNGDRISWYQNGFKYMHERYLDGLREGKSEQWIDEDRKIFGNFHKGKNDGMVVFENKKYKTYFTVNFKGGLLHGKLEAHIGPSTWIDETDISVSFNNGVPDGRFIIAIKDNDNFLVEGEFKQTSNIIFDKTKGLSAEDANNFKKFFYSYCGIGLIWNRKVYNDSGGLFPSLRNCIAKTETHFL